MNPTGKFHGRSLLAAGLIAGMSLSLSDTGLAQDSGTIPGPGRDEPIAVDGRPGYDQPNQYLHVQPVAIAPNMEPAILHPDQDAEAREKLAALEQQFGKKPNLLIFLMDDVGWLDWGFNGGGISVGNDTAATDAIAADGLVLTSAYSQPTCSPTRATIMTGQYPIHHGILSPPMYGQPGGLDGLITIAQLLKDAGYTTQAIGKWHIGENAGSQPNAVGFDNFRGFLSVSDMYTEWRDPHYNPEVALSPGRYDMISELPFNKNDVRIAADGTVEELGLIDVDYIKDLDQRWKDEGVSFIQSQAQSDKPFFLYYNTRGCHFDNYPNEYYAGRSAARTVYSDCIVELNDVFMALYNALEESGQLDNTLIFFTSDNGPEQEVAPYGRTIFRGGKGSTWEGGVRVPTFVYWRGMIEPRKSEGLFDMSDLFPTFLSLSGTTGADIGALVPSDRYIDGIDQTSFLLAENGESNRRSILYFLNEELSGVRIDEFKYMQVVQLPHLITQTGYQGGISGGIVHSAGSTIFNLYSNPQEDDSVGIRHIPIGVPLLTEMQRYQAVMEKFPVTVQIKVE